MVRRIKGAFKRGKLKIIDMDGKVIDTVHPFAIEDTLDVLQLKYGKKKKKPSEITLL